MRMYKALGLAAAAAGALVACNEGSPGAAADNSTAPGTIQSGLV